MQHILIVDDDAVITHAFAQAFQRHGYRVTEAANGFAALEISRTDPVEGVVTDFYMPGMNGLELLSQLRERQPDLPALVVSGIVKEIGAAGLRTKMVSKLINAETLVGMMTTLLEFPGAKESNRS